MGTNSQMALPKLGAHPGYGGILQREPKTEGW